MRCWAGWGERRARGWWCWSGSCWRRASLLFYNSGELIRYSQALSARTVSLLSKNTRSVARLYCIVDQSNFAVKWRTKWCDDFCKFVAMLKAPQLPSKPLINLELNLTWKLWTKFYSTLMADSSEVPQRKRQVYRLQHSIFRYLDRLFPRPLRNKISRRGRVARFEQEQWRGHQQQWNS